MRSLAGSVLHHLAAAISLALLAGAGVAQSSTSWTGAALSSSWSDAGNWSNGVPDPTKDAVIGGPFAFSPSTAGTAAPACRSLTVQAQGSLDLAVGSPLRVHADSTIFGAISGGGWQILMGSGTAQSVAPAVMPSTEVAGTYTLTGSVAGDLLQTAGVVAYSFSLTVAQNATFQGTRLDCNGGLGAPLLDVQGDVTISTTGITTLMPGAGNIHCGGNWNSNVNFQPAGGVVTFDGTGTQLVVTNAPSGLSQWFGLTVETFSLVTLAGLGLDLDGPLRVNGTLGTTGSSVVVAGVTTLGANATFTASAATTVDLASMDIGAGATFSVGASVLHIAGTCIVNGNLLAPNARLLADDFFSASGGSVVTLGPNHGVNQPHTFLRDCICVGTLNAGAGSVFKLDGFGLAWAGSGQGSFPTTVVDGDYTLRGGTVDGDLQQTAGVLAFSQFPVVTGNATFQGLRLDGANGPPTLDVRGNIVLGTTGVSTLVPGGCNIHCGGNWNSNVNFQPATGTVTFNGTGTQTVTAVFLNLVTTTVSSGSNLVLQQVTNLTIQQDLTVNGTFSTPAASLDVQRDLIVGATGTVTVGAGNHRVDRNLTVNGTTTGPGELVLDGTGTLSGSGTIGSVRVDTLGTVTSGNVNLTGDFALTNGTLSIPSGNTLRVQGESEFFGGTLVGAAGSTLDLDGPATFAGATAGATLPVLRVSSSWTADAIWLPDLVIFDPTGPGQVTINSTTGAGLVRFQEMQMQTGGTRVGNPGQLQAARITVAAGALFDLGSVSLLLSTVLVEAIGEVRMTAGAHIRLGHGSRVSVAATTGILSLLGEPGNRCVVSGDGTGTWRLAVQGLLRATEFELRDLEVAYSPTDRGGVRLLPGAQIASAPLDFSDGLLAGSTTDPLGVLLSLENGQSRDFYGLEFRDTGVVPFKNVATQASAPLAYRFFEYDGNLGGAGFEQDPFQIVDWLSQGRTTITSVTARSGLHRIQVDFATGIEVGTTTFRVFRRDMPGGTPTLAATFPAQGTPQAGASYSFVDAPLPGLTRFYYEVQDERPNRPARRLAEVSARPWQAQVGNSYFVGSGGYGDIAAAIAAAPDGATIVVTSGIYPSFTLDRPMRILPDGSGPVVVDTSLGPVLVQNMPAGLDVALYGFQVGAANGLFGVVIQNCDNVVVVDGVSVVVGAQATALRIDDCPQVALQQVDAQGQIGVQVENQSTVFVSRGNLSSLQVSNTSRVAHAGLTVGASNHDPSSVVTAIAGTSPRLDGSMAWGPGETLVSVTTDPGDFQALLAGFGRGWTDLSPALPVDMVLLMNPAMSFTVASSQVGANGIAEVPVVLFDNPAVWGGVLSLQTLVLRASAPRPFRFGNVRDVVFVP